MPKVFVIEDVLAAHQIDCLRNDCRHLQTARGLCGDDLATTSCSVDPFEFASLPDRHPVRTQPKVYLTERFRYSSSDAAVRNSFASIALDLIPNLLRRLLCQSSVFLFSENYIVKPSHSDIAFRWHRDADEQLACLPPASHSLYVSCWCPLDDTSNFNGTLC